MPGPGIEAELPPESGSEKGRLQGTVRLSGQLTPENGVREVLAQITQLQDVQFGLLRILSKGIRGYIGFTNGQVITGAHVTSTREYGLTALRQLLTAQKGIFVVMAMTAHPIELRQALKLSIVELLNYRSPGQPETSMNDALLYFATRHADYFEVNEAAEAAAKTGGELAEFESYMAWGGEAPVLANNLSRLTGQFSKPGQAQAKAPVEIIMNRQIDQQPQQAPDPSSMFPPQPAPQRPFPQQPQSQQPFAQQPQGQQPFPQPQGNPPQQPPFPQQPQPTQMPPQQPRNPQQQQQQVMDDLNRAFSGKTTNPVPMEAFNPNAPRPQQQPRPQPQQAPPEQPAPAAGKQSGAQAKPAGANRDDEQSVSQRVAKLREDQTASQKLRMQDIKDIIDDDDGPPEILTPAQRRRKEIMSIISGAVGVLLFLALGQQVFNITTGNAKYHSGIAALKAGDNARAQVELTTAINLDGGKRAYLYRAVAESRLGHKEKALADFNYLIGKNGQDPLARAGRATLKIKTKEYDAAIADCNEILSFKPDYADAYRLKALANCAAGRYKEAIDEATTFLTSSTAKVSGDKGRSEVFSCRAYAFYKVKKFDQAILDYTEAIALDPKNFHLYSSRAITYKRLKAWAHALEDVKFAITLSPSDPGLYKLRGQLYQNAGDAARAAVDMDTAVKMKPSIEAFKLRGSARLSAKDYEGALEDFEYVLSVRPNDKDSKAKYDQARKMIASGAKSIDIAKLDLPKDEPKGPPKGGPVTAPPGTATPATGTAPHAVASQSTGATAAAISKGYAQLQAGHWGPAVQLLTAAVKSNPNDPLARRYLAYAFYRQGDHKNAAQQFNVVQSLDTLAPEDKVLYGKSLIGCNKFGEAVQVFGPLVAENPGNDPARQGLINAYIGAHAYRQAQQLAQEGAARNPAMAKVYGQLLQAASRK